MITEQEMQEEFNGMWDTVVESNPNITDSMEDKMSGWKDFMDMLVRDGIVTEDETQGWVSLF